MHIYLELGITPQSDVNTFMAHAAPQLAAQHSDRQFELIPAARIGLVRDYPTREQQSDGTYCRSVPVDAGFNVLISRKVLA